MHADQRPYRELYEAILDYEGDELSRDVLTPWLNAADEERRWLEAFGRRRGSPIPDPTIEELWRMFALSRVAQLLIRLHPAQLPSLLDPLGPKRVGSRACHPFLHEIVAVEQADDEPVVVEETCTKPDQDR